MTQNSAAFISLLNEQSCDQEPVEDAEEIDPDTSEGSAAVERHDPQNDAAANAFESRHV
jgi:hypothetical protein